jgi:hypothetical protein
MSTRLREIDDGEDRKTNPLDKDGAEKSNHGVVTGTPARTEDVCADEEDEKPQEALSQVVTDIREQMRQMPLPEVLDLASIVERLQNEGKISYRYFVKRDSSGNLPNNIPRPSPAMVYGDIIDSITSHLQNADIDGKMARLTRISKIVITIINGELFAVCIIAGPNEEDGGNDNGVGANGDTERDEEGGPGCLN